MMLKKYFLLLGCLAGAQSRDLKFSKPMPAISNSLVNFGKMDISFYLSDKFKDLVAKRDSPANPYNPLSSTFLHDPSKEDHATCPCSNLRNLRDPFSSHPSEILNKILMSNDLFSFNKEMISSTLCCDSHENVHEEGVFFEFSPRQNQMLANPMQANPHMMPSLTRILDNVFPRRPTIPIDSIKPPAIDIFLFPKKKSSTEKVADFFLQKKADVHAVGDSEINKEMKPISLTPSITNKASVKKDLGTKKPIDEKQADLNNNTVTISNDTKK